MGDTGLKKTSYRKVVKYVNKKGFEIRTGGRHAIATNSNGVLISIPRHNAISIGVTGKIFRQLIDECGFDESEVYKNLK